MSLAGISIRRPVATTMVMLSFIFIGLLAMFSMKKELIPNIKIPVVTITTTWNGAVSEDVEAQVTKKIKDSLSNVEAIDKIQTVSAYGVSTVVVNFDYGVDTDEKVTQIQREVSKIANNLPSDANTPLVRKIEAAGGNMTAVIAFNADSKTALTTFIKEQLKPRLESLPGIGQVDIFGNPDKQLQIQVDSDKLASYNLSPMELYNIVRTSVATYPIGKLSTGNKDMIIRFMGELDYIDQYKNILISSDGNTLRLKDVADIVLTTEDADNIGYLNGKDLKIGIVVARFNEFITSKLLSGAIDTLRRHETNEDDIDVAWVPGAFEIPVVAKKLAQTGKYDAVICLGAVIRGSTTHYDYVCNEVSKGVAQVGMSTGVPTIFGVVTTENIEQAVERAGTKAGNKGSDAAMAAMEMASLLKKIK